MSLTAQQRASLVAEIATDPTGRQYLTFAPDATGPVFRSDAPEFNTFNLLRDPAWGEQVGDVFVQGLAALGIAESEMTVDDVRAALAQARA